TLGEICGALQPTAPATAGAEASLLATVAEKTGYPVEMLHLDMDLEADLGIDSIKRVEILAGMEERHPGLSRVAPDQVGALRTLRQVVQALSGPSAAPSPAPEPPPVQASLQRSVLRLRPATGSGGALELAPGTSLVVWDPSSELGPALVAELNSRGIPARTEPDGEALGGLILLGNGSHLKEAFRLVQSHARALREAAASGGALLATVSRMDGRFGHSGRGDALSGGLAGLPRTVAHEWPGVQCRILDVPGDWPEAARAVAEELAGGGPLEVALSPDGRMEPVAEPVPAGASQPPSLNPEDVVVVTGGARGVTAAVALALARHCRPTLALLGRSPEPFPEPDWMQGLATEAEVKRGIAKERNGSLRPTDLEDSYRRYAANREVQTTLEEIRRTGARVAYYSVDVRDREALARTLERVRADLGPVRGVIHAAGVLADRRLEEKKPEQFDAVFDTKVEGARNLLELTRPDDLSLLLFFSSVTARFGRPGQVDYCMANEVLNRLAHREALLRPAARVASLGWGPWDGGMVNAGLAREFARLGVGLIGLEQGAEALLAELTAPRDEVELLLGSGLPAPPEPRQTPVLELMLSVGDFPFLESHVLSGRPVLPVAMMLEWFAHAALHAHPGLRFVGVEDLAVFSGVSVENGSRPVAISAGTVESRDAFTVVPVELVDPSSGRVHARARVFLSAELPSAPDSPPPDGLAERSFPAAPEEIYSRLLFHGPHFHAIGGLEGISGKGLVASLSAAPRPSHWMAEPPRSEWVSDPLALDGVLQLGILWCREELGKPSLPSRIGSYRQFQTRFPRDGVRAELRVQRHGPNQLVADVTLLDAQDRPVAAFTGLEWTADASLEGSFRATELAPGGR
ncbi:MAG: SDR family NAD(P)-dependent oxidoreductase, partial [Candidatus Eremiobacterota bacterium]